MLKRLKEGFEKGIRDEGADSVLQPKQQPMPCHCCAHVHRCALLEVTWWVHLRGKQISFEWLIWNKVAQHGSRAVILFPKVHR